MLSVLRLPPSYAKFARDELSTPFHCFHQPSVNRLKRSPQFNLGYNYNCSYRSCFKSFCKGNEQVTHDDIPLFKGFSALQEEDSPWEIGNVWSTLALYVFTLHIPFSFGGLSVVASLTAQPNLDPQIEALSLLGIQILELNGALFLLKYTAKPHYKFTNFFKNNKLMDHRNWLLASALGFGLLVLIIFLTTLLADRLFGSKAVNNPILKEILLDSDISRVSCVLVYCIVTPLLEEIVYRGFLLTSLSSTMKWHQAVAISSVIFSVIHFSGENFLQLFIIGCVLGCSYCWTGNLISSIAIHSLYNALTLVLSYFY